MSIRICALTILLVAIAIAPAHLQAPSVRAKAADVHGQVERRAASNPDDRWSAISAGDLLGADSAVRTAAGSAVLLVLPDAHVIRIGENNDARAERTRPEQLFFLRAPEREDLVVC